MDSPRTTRAPSLLLVLALGLGIATTAQAGGGSHAQVLVSTRVATFFRVGDVQQPQTIVVEERHVRQGYVDLPAAASFRVASNTGAPIIVRVGYDESLVERVELLVADHAIVAEHPGDGGLVPNPVRGERRLPVGYRIHLQPTATPGVHRWPVAMALTPSA